MNRYRPTTLRLADRHCPRAVDFYEADRARFRDIFAAGIAAHAVLDVLGMLTQRRGAALDEATARAAADDTAKKLMVDGRTFDGAAEPPLPASAVLEGRDLALAWALRHPLSPTARYELGAGFDRDWRPVGYGPAARFRLILDVFDIVEEEAGEESGGGRGVVVRDYKSAWSTDLSELDTVQMKAQAVAAALLVAAPIQIVGPPPGAEQMAELIRKAAASPIMLPAAGAEVVELRPLDFVRQEVVNLRTQQTFGRTIYLDEAGQAVLAGWQRDITMTMDALDELQPRVRVGQVLASSRERCEVVAEGRLMVGPRPARPGAGCVGCPWVLSCADAASLAVDVLGVVGGTFDAATLGAAYAIVEGQRDALRALVEAAADEGAVPVPGGRVGMVGRPAREPKKAAPRLAWDAWRAAVAQRTGAEGEALDAAALPGFLQALKVGGTGLEAVAKVLAPRDKAAQAALLAGWMDETTRRSFGVHKGEPCGDE